MSALRFSLDLESYEVSEIDLPVAVHDLDLQVQARGLISHRLAVEPGTYTVITRLPAGQTLTAGVTVAAGEERTVHLTADRWERSPHENEELARLVWGYEPAPAPPGAVSTRSVATIGLRGFVRGTPFAGYVERSEPLEPITRPVADALRVAFPYDQKPLDLVQVNQPNRPPQHIVLPPAEAPGTYEISLTPIPDGTVEATAHLSHRMADAMLQYRRQGLLGEAAAMAADVGERSEEALRRGAEELLYDKVTSPLAAAAGAYVLLRIGDLERLHDWTENLFNWFEWLPDGAAIRAEHLAREGRHDEAVARLLALRRRGLPLFSEGLGYAVQRLDLYSATRRDARLGALLKALLPVSLATDFTKSFTSFGGGDPSHPTGPLGGFMAGAPHEESNSQVGSEAMA